jgi:hypothetical protein
VLKEVNPPPASTYLGIGWDNIDSENNLPADPMRHYRKMYNDELENNKEIFSRSPFHKFDIMRA